MSIDSLSGGGPVIVGRYNHGQRARTSQAGQMGF